jgi:hypothetical protein
MTAYKRRLVAKLFLGFDPPIIPRPLALVWLNAWPVFRRRQLVSVGIAPRHGLARHAQSAAARRYRPSGATASSSSR